MNKWNQTLDISKRRQGFERSAKTYNEAAFLQKEIAKRLIERLDYIKLDPNVILDLGAGTGFVTHAIKQKYPKAMVIAYDISLNMIKENRLSAPWFKKPKGVCGMAEALPFKAASIDLVLSNFMLQWCDDLSHVFSELKRVLSSQGGLFFTTFGPDTLKELRECWHTIDDKPHIHSFQDMHNIGDAMLKAGLQQPVMDMEMLTLTYRDLMLALNDLKKIGATNAVSSRSKGLMGRSQLKKLIKMYESYRNNDGLLPVSYEVLYGHAWSPYDNNEKKQSDNNIIKIHEIDAQSIHFAKDRY